MQKTLTWTQLGPTSYVSPLTENTSLQIEYERGLYVVRFMRRSDGEILPFHIKGGACLDLAKQAAQKFANHGVVIERQIAA